MKNVDPVPFFSVVVATYNASATVRKCLDSLLSQSEKPEILVIDGASKDSTVDIVQDYADRQGIKFISERDQGVFDAWNKGVRLAHGRWLIFVGADDYYSDPDSLAFLRAQLDLAADTVEVVYGKVEVVDNSGRIISTENQPWTLCEKLLPVNMPFTHTGTAHKRSLFEGRQFNPEFRIAGDYHFLYPSLAKRKPLYLSKYIVQMGDGGLSNSVKNRICLIREIKRIQLENNVRNSLKQRAWLDLKLSYYKLRGLLGHS